MSAFRAKADTASDPSNRMDVPAPSHPWGFKGWPAICHRPKFREVRARYLIRARELGNTVAGCF